MPNCQKCGFLMNESAKFCEKCGAPTIPGGSNNPNIEVPIYSVKPIYNPFVILFRYIWIFFIGLVAFSAPLGVVLVTATNNQLMILPAMGIWVVLYPVIIIAISKKIYDNQEYSVYHNCVEFYTGIFKFNRRRIYFSDIQSTHIKTRSKRGVGNLRIAYYAKSDTSYDRYIMFRDIPGVREFKDQLSRVNPSPVRKFFNKFKK